MRTVAAFGILLLGGCSVDTPPLEYKPLAQDADWEPPERTSTPIQPLLAPRVVQWWRDAGGEAVTFGSDAHDPETVAHGFADAAAMAEAYGFRPGQDAFEMWGRA